MGALSGSVRTRARLHIASYLFGLIRLAELGKPFDLWNVDKSMKNLVLLI